MTRLLLDVMLGKLARYLRMCGFDAAYALDRGVEGDEAVLALAGAEGRRVITRDRRLADRAPDAVIIESTAIEEQLRELRDAGFDLALDEPTRCGQCNGSVVPVASTTPTPEYAPSSADEPVWRCEACGQYYWRGSHWDDVRDRLTSL